MANGGIIGPTQTVTAASCISAKVTSFTSSGTFTAQATANVDYLVVGGGGGSGEVTGSNSRGGGGGAGGYRASGFGPSPLQGSAVPVVGGTGYTVTVGGGGPASCSAPVGNGVASVFNHNGGCITAAGGGHGASHRTAAQDGGSGGAGAPGACSGASGNVPPVSPPQGNNGNTGTGEGPVPSRAGGGGGGATAAGSRPAGGAGAPNTISGSDVTYAAGGAGAPGSPNSAGSANTGNGGNAAPSTGGNAGGPGIVIVKEPAVSVPASAPGIWDISTVYELRKEGVWTGF